MTDILIIANVIIWSTAAAIFGLSLVCSYVQHVIKLARGE